MKALVKILLGLAITYWVAVAGAFTTVMIWPEAAIGIVQTLETLTPGEEVSLPSSSIEELSSSLLEESSLVEESSSIADESSIAEESSSEEVATSVEESSSEEITSSQEGSSLPETQPLRQANGDIVCTLECIDDPLTEEVECLSSCEFETAWVGYDISTEMPAEPVHGDAYIVIDNDDDLFHSMFVFVVSTDLNENGEEIIVSEWVEVFVPIGQTEGYDLYYDPQLGQLFLLELIEIGGVDPLPEEESPTAEEIAEAIGELEKFIIEGAIVMLPITILLFVLNSKLSENETEVEMLLRKKIREASAKPGKKGAISKLLSRVAGIAKKRSKVSKQPVQIQQAPVQRRQIVAPLNRGINQPQVQQVAAPSKKKTNVLKAISSKAKSLAKSLVSKAKSIFKKK